MGTYRTDTLEVVGKKYFNTGGAQKMYSKESVPIISERPFQTRGAVFGYFLPGRHCTALTTVCTRVCVYGTYVCMGRGGRERRTADLLRA